jgi:hypothetical protein
MFESQSLSLQPSMEPTEMIHHTMAPTIQPTIVGSFSPTMVPTMAPSTTAGSAYPTMVPTITLTTFPTIQQTIITSMYPTISLTLTPTSVYTNHPSILPTLAPTTTATHLLSFGVNLSFYGIQQAFTQVEEEILLLTLCNITSLTMNDIEYVTSHTISTASSNELQTFSNLNHLVMAEFQILTNIPTRDSVSTTYTQYITMINNTLHTHHTPNTFLTRLQTALAQYSWTHNTTISTTPSITHIQQVTFTGSRLYTSSEQKTPAPSPDQGTNTKENQNLWDEIRGNLGILIGVAVAGIVLGAVGIVCLYFLYRCLRKRCCVDERYDASSAANQSRGWNCCCCCASASEPTFQEDDVLIIHV